MSTASKGSRMLNERIKHYENEGWVLLDKERRSRFGIQDVLGVWDLVMAIDSCDGVKYLLFAQVGTHSHKSDKMKECMDWIDKYLPRTMLQSCLFNLDLYRPPHYEGRGKNKVWINRTTWESINLGEYL